MLNYKNKLYNYPNITIDEEHELVKNYKENNCIKSRDKLILAHTKLVLAMAYKLNGYKLSVEDLVQEGSIGLIKALDTFDLSVGVRFSTHATYYIKNEQLKFILNNVKIVRFAKSKPMLKLFFNFRELKHKLIVDGVSTSLNLSQLEFIAKELDVPLKDVFDMNEQMIFGDKSIDYTNDESDIAPNTGEYLFDYSTIPDVMITKHQLDNIFDHHIPEIMLALDSRSQKIIQDRFMVDVPKTRSEISSEFGISQQRVAQIESKALLKLRESLESSYWI